MPDETQAMLRRLDTIERNQTDQAGTLTAEAHAIDGLEKADRAAEIERVRREGKDAALELRLGAIEQRINGIYRLGFWVLTAFGTSTVALLVNFLFKGGIVVK